VSHEDPQTPAEAAGRPSVGRRRVEKGSTSLPREVTRKEPGGWPVILIINDRAVHRAYPPRTNKESRGDPAAPRRSPGREEGDAGRDPAR